MIPDIFDYTATECILCRTLNALRRLYTTDQHLIDNKIYEVAITHKLAVYIQDEFSHWNVDCEYDQNLKDPKKINNYPTNGDDNCVRPDIIVHKRGTDRNLLVIEVKKIHNSNTSNDLKKIQEYIQDCRLHYEFGVCIVLSNDKVKLAIYKRDNTIAKEISKQGCVVAVDDLLFDKKLFASII